MFLDCAGVLIDHVDRGPDFRATGYSERITVPFNVSELRVRPNVLDALTLMGEKGYRRIMATNQSVVATGRVPPGEYARMMDVFRAYPIDAIYACVHAADAGCDCHKPAPGMLLRAAAEHGIDLANSYMVGDRETDVMAGKAAGTHTILVSPHVYVTTGAEHRVMNVMEAAQFIPRLA